MMIEPSGSGNRRRRLVVLIGRIALILLVVVTLPVAPPWIGFLVPVQTRLLIAAGILTGLQIVHLLIWGTVPVGAIVLSSLLVRARRRGQRRPLLARLLLLGVSVLIGLITLEGAAAVWRARQVRLPRPPTQFAQEPDRDLALPSQLVSGSTDEVEILVLGESSAKGDPYQPWLSVGQIVAWQLERVFPRRRFHVTMWAVEGAALEQMHARLTDLTRCPDIILLYCGHNQFAAHFGFSREVVHYLDERPRRPVQTLRERIVRFSPLGAMIDEVLEHWRGGLAPERLIMKRALVDHPVCGPEEYAARRADFHRRVEAITAYAEQIGALPILIVPPGNDADFEPNRSVLPAATTKAQREAFTRQFLAVRQAEAADPAGALTQYRALLERYPDFAETHFRLARLLEQAGAWAEADYHYQRARDLDGLPVRCPTDFQTAYHEAAARHSSAILIDGPAVLRRLSPHGLLDDHAFHDGQHPTLRSYAALAQEILEQLRTRQALGWPEGVAAPAIDPKECAIHFGMNQARWIIVCERGRDFYYYSTHGRFDPAERGVKARRYNEAVQRLMAGVPPEQAEVPGMETFGLRANPREQAISQAF